MEWLPMTANPFPWKHREVIVAAFYRDQPDLIDIFRCRCAEHGAYFIKSHRMLSIIEEGWVPFAWRADDTPDRDDNKYPPVWSDYLTDAASS